MGGIRDYNNKRIKYRLKGKSPVQYRTLSITRTMFDLSNFWGHFK
ncbi:MAG: IS3 family transposase [Bacteroides sp.]|nr:IS3 family transposase [Bacteroides sp.]